MAAQHLTDRLRALQIVSGAHLPSCARCGAADFRVLQINHLNGGGRSENRLLPPRAFIRAIISGDRGHDDLNVLCANCNQLYEFERGRRRLPRDWEAVAAEVLG